jgi:senataxin
MLFQRRTKVKVVAPVTTGGSKCSIRLNEIVTHQQAAPPTPEQAKKCGRKTKPLQVIIEGLRRSSRLNEKGKHEQVAPSQKQAKKHGRMAKTLTPVTTEDLRRSAD